MGIPKRFYDDIVSRAVELNLGIVDKVHTTNNQSDTEKYSAQLIKLKPLKILPTCKDLVSSMFPYLLIIAKHCLSNFLFLTGNNVIILRF